MTLSETQSPPEVETRDDQVITLRECGCTYLDIATQLDLGRATMARRCYLRGLKRRLPEEQIDLRRRELARFDALAENIASREDLDEQEITRRLATVEMLRHELLDG
ncbi:MAG TPA: hypothetical protein VNG12_17575 [Acidimicrobiales bacterium]|nr:hypothetical protein [Acidimicrobiales bacterium]